jgi:hypothetical protein
LARVGWARSISRIKKLQRTYAQSGFRAYVEKNVEQTISERNVSPFVLATFYAKLGRTDGALRLLEKGYEERDFRMTLLSVSLS